MRTRKYTTEKNLRKLKEVEALIIRGSTPPEASRQTGISIQTFYLWRRKYGRMRAMNYTTEKNIRKLKEIEILISQGLNPPEASRKSGISIRTFYRWRREYGRMRVDQAKRLIDLEKESILLKRRIANRERDIRMLKETLYL